MNTGMVETWMGNPLDIGPMYPFVGSEWLFLLISVIGWLVWHIWQIKSENATYDEQSSQLQGDALTEAINSGK